MCVHICSIALRLEKHSFSLWPWGCAFLSFSPPHQDWAIFSPLTPYLQNHSFYLPSDQWQMAWLTGPLHQSGGWEGGQAVK